MTTNNMVRIQIELPEDKVRALEALMAEVGVSTKKELFNNALTVLEWMVNETTEGRVIASINEQTMSYKQLAMPILSAVSDKVKRARQAEKVPAVA
jgi:hypothetical protein